MFYKVQPQGPSMRCVAQSEWSQRIFFQHDCFTPKILVCRLVIFYYYRSLDLVFSVLSMHGLHSQDIFQHSQAESEVR